MMNSLLDFLKDLKLANNVLRYRYFEIDNRCTQIKPALNSLFK